MREWMRRASKKQQLELAKRAKTTQNYLYQIASGHRTASADAAGRIEVASRKVGDKLGELPPINRADLCPACASCPYNQQCKE